MRVLPTQFKLKKKRRIVVIKNYMTECGVDEDMIKDKEEWLGKILKSRIRT